MLKDSPKSGTVLLPLRLTVPFALLLFVTAVTWWTLHTSRQHIRETVAIEAVRDLRWVILRLERSLERSARVGDMEAIREDLSALGADLEVEYAVLADEDDQVVASIRLADIGRPLHDVLPGTYRNPSKIQPQSVDDSRPFMLSSVDPLDDGRTIVGTIPVVLGRREGEMHPKRIGTLIVVHDTALASQKAFQAVRNQALGFLCMLGAFTVGLGIFFHFGLANRLRRLAETATQVSAGAMDVRTGVAGHDEVASLAGSLDRMIAERARVEQLLRDREQRLQRILNSVEEGIVTVDRQGFITEVNPFTEQMFGYSDKEMIGHNMSMLMPSTLHENGDNDVEHYVTDETKLIGMRREVLGRRKDGSSFPVYLSISEIKELEIFVGFVQDITRRKELQTHLATIATEEQERIARDLHDGLGGYMTGMGVLAKILHARLDEKGSPEAPKAAELLKYTREAHEQLREVSRGLNPVDVAPQGLMVALALLVTKSQHRTGVECIFLCDRPAEIESHTIATNLYYITQEAVTNAIRHGKAKRVQINLVETSSSVTMTVKDDGIGFEHNPYCQDSRGLRTMKYRADLIGAALSIGPAEGGGTMVRCIITKNTCP